MLPFRVYILCKDRHTYTDPIKAEVRVTWVYVSYSSWSNLKRWSLTDFDVTARLCIRCMWARLYVLASWICCLLIFVALQTHLRHLHHRFTAVLLRWSLPSFWLRPSHYRPFVVFKKGTTTKVMSYLFSSQLKAFEVAHLCFVSCSSSIHRSMIFRKTFRYHGGRG